MSTSTSTSTSISNPSAPTTRPFNGTTVPEAGRYVIDPSHTDVAFVAKHLMVTKVRGRFSEFDGAVTVTEDPLASSVSVDIRTASLDSRDADRDAHVRSADLLDVESFPTMSFASTAVRHLGDNRFAVEGDLTIRDVARTVVLDMELDGVVGDPWGGTRIAFSAGTEINREDWDLTWNVALDTGGVLVSKKVRIEIEGQAVREA
jgi:polyisoprenoid-binding protein YceI